MSEQLATRQWADRPFTSRLSKYSENPYGLKVWWILSMCVILALLVVGVRVGVIASQYTKVKADAVMWAVMDASETAVFVLRGADGEMIDANAVAKRKFPFAIQNGRLTNNLPYGDAVRAIVDDNIRHARENGHYHVTVVQLPATTDGTRQAAVIRTTISGPEISTLFVINSTDAFIDLSGIDIATN